MNIIILAMGLYSLYLGFAKKDLDPQKANFAKIAGVCLIVAGILNTIVFMFHK